MANCLLPAGSNNSTAIEIINFFIKKGLTVNQALGICANVFQESSYDPQARNKTSGAYGLFQWLGSREQNLIKFCNKNGLNKTWVRSQLEFCWYENDKSPKNNRRVWEYYGEHRGMSAMDSLIYWEQHWERCGNATSGCHRKKRVGELNRLVELYKKNGSTECTVDIGGADGDLGDAGCDETSLANEESTENGSATDTKKYYSNDHPWEPLGVGVANTKPVIFGGSWAYKLSPYMTGNRDYFSYAQWGQAPTIPIKGQYSSMYFGGVNDKYKANIASTKSSINNYIGKSGNNPSHIIVTVDLETPWYKPKKCMIMNGQAIAQPRDEDIYTDLKSLFIKFFGGINVMRVYVPLLIPSWSDDHFVCGGKAVSYALINQALKKAASLYDNIRIIEVTETISKGDKKPANGILPESAWNAYADAIKRAIN